MRAANWLSPCMLLIAAACGGGTTSSDQAESRQAVAAVAAFAQPAGTVAVNFAVDDRANQAYAAGELRWKGSFLVDEVTRILTFDSSWSGSAPDAQPLSGWPVLYDDGPWTAGGHEPTGASAGDSIWGITVFVAPPATGSDTYEYGLLDATVADPWNFGWVWQGPNGTFSVAAGATADITAPGMTFARFGDQNLMLVLDTHRLWPGYAWNTGTVTVKGSAWGWVEVPLTSLGRGKYAFLLSTVVGAGHQLPHFGLLNPGDVPEFVFVLGGEEYKVWYTDDDGMTWYPVVPANGVSAAILSPCFPWIRPVRVINVDDGNTAVTVPETRACGHCGR